MIDFINFIRLNFLSKKIIRTKGFIIPYYGTSFKFSNGSSVEINDNVHIGKKHFLAKRKKLL